MLQKIQRFENKEYWRDIEKRSHVFILKKLKLEKEQLKLIVQIRYFFHLKNYYIYRNVKHWNVFPFKFLYLVCVMNLVFLVNKHDFLW